MLAMTDGLLTTSGLAKELHLHPETIREWVRDGKIRPTLRTAGGHARFELAQVRQQLAEAQGDRKAGEHREPTVPPYEPIRPAQAGVTDTPADQQEWDPNMEGAVPQTRAQAEELIGVLAYALERGGLTKRQRQAAERKITAARYQFGIPAPTDD